VASKTITLPISPTAAHSRLGASSSHRWMHCTASVGLIESLEFKGDRATTYNVEGHLAHDIGARCIETGADAWQFVGEQHTEGDITEIFDPEDASAVQTYVAAIRAKRAEATAIYVETRFHCPDIHKDFFGQTDCALVFEDRIEVWDYKHGIGVPVHAEHNTQLMMYAVGVIRDLLAKGVAVPENVKVVICQPRAYHPSGVIRHWTTTRTYLETWIKDDWLPAAYETESNTPIYMAGSWCQFCPAKLDCPLMRHKMKVIKALTPDKVKLMTDEELASLNADLEHLAYMRKAAADETFSRLMNGRKIAGSKLVHAKTDRVWKDGAEDDLRLQFGDELYDRKIKSPAAVAKMPGGATLVRKWAYKPEGKMTVAPESDVRVGQTARTLKEVFGLT
jgi:hypothetical protein